MSVFKPETMELRTEGAPSIELKPRKCHECGVGRLALVAKAGRTTPYRNIEALPIPADFEIPTCVHCGAEWYGEDIAKALDAVLERQYQSKLRGDAAPLGAACPPKTEPETPWDWMLLNRTNELARSRWNIGGDSPRLPPAPDGSGCSYHYCWMPCVRNDGEGGQFCAAHGGKDAPLPLWPLRDMRDRTADALADEVDLLVRNKVIDSRSPTADALLDYRNNPRTPRSDRLRSLEQEVVRLGEWVDELTDHSPPAEPAPATLRQLLQKTLRRGGGALLPLSARPARVAEVLRLTILRQQRMSGRWKALAKRFKEELTIATSEYLRAEGVTIASKLPCGHKVEDLMMVADSTYRCVGCCARHYLPADPGLKP